MKGAFFAGLILVVAVAGCQTTETTNENLSNANTGANRNVNHNANANVATVNSNRELSREEFERERARFEREAREVGSRIGSGAEDLWLWFKTRAALTTASDLRDSTINVDVNNSVVTLRGSVANADQKHRAVEIARSIEGVKSVRDELKVSASGETNANSRSATNHNGR